MILAGQFCKSLIRICHDHFRSRKFCTCCHRISKQFIAQSHLETCLVKLITLGLADKISTVHKKHSVAVSDFFRCCTICKDHTRIILMTGTATATANPVRSMSHRNTFQIALHSMSAIKTDCIVVSLYKIKACGQCFFHGNRFCSCIFDHYTSGNDIRIFQYTVKQMYFYLCQIIF